MLVFVAMVMAGCSGSHEMTQPVTGTLAIAVQGLPSGAPAAITISNGGTYAHFATGNETIGNLLPGTYEIAAGSTSAAGQTYAAAPATQTQTVNAGGTVNSVVVYTLVQPAPTLGAVQLIVAGLPGGTAANVVITGPNNYSRTVAGSQLMTDLAPGSYTVEASGVVAGGAPFVPQATTQILAVGAGAVVQVAVTYAPPAYSPLMPGYHAQTMLVDGVVYRYQFFVPQSYAPGTPVPVILSLHGSGEAGTDNTKQLSVGLAPYVTAHASTFPAVVVFPQVPAGNGGNTGEGARDFQRRLYMTAFNETLLQVNGDRSRLYISGNSIGAVRAWDLLYRNADVWAGALLAAGFLYGPGLTSDAATTNAQGIALAAARLTAMPIRTFHSSANPDDNTGYIEDRDINTAFLAAGSAVFRYTEYAGIDHASTWMTAYNDPATWDWLFAQHR